MRTVLSCVGWKTENSRDKLGDEAEFPRCIFTELGVGYRMPKGEAQDERAG